MKTTWVALCAAAAILSGCGGENHGSTAATSASPGSLLVSPSIRVASVTASTFESQLKNTSSGEQLLTLLQETGLTPVCGIDFHYLQYGTVGGANEATTASGAMLVPTGSAPQCKGSRPIVLYAHGTTTSRGYNIADITDPNNAAYNELGLIAAMFAAQGYIVVAPNYAGYDSSTLSYHPYLNETQQATEMINALTAARSALPGTPAGASVSDSGKLFITGYSQGGYVAMATLKAMQNANMTVTAAAPMSGPYALEAFGDAVFYGNVNIGATVFSPLLAESFQHQNNANGNFAGTIYASTSDIFTSTYATGIDSLLPSNLSESDLFSTGKLPELAEFEQDPAAPAGADTSTQQLYALMDTLSPPSSSFAPFFATSGYLINTPYRAAYLSDAIGDPDGTVPSGTTYMPAASTPTNTFRAALRANDLRVNGSAPFLPTAPVLLCGGHFDPTVFYSVNTQNMSGIWSAAASSDTSLVFAQIDADGTSDGSGTVTATGTGPFASSGALYGTLTAIGTAAQNIFAGGAAAYASDPSGFEQNYHGGIVPPACTFAAQAFFSIYLNQ